MEWRRPHQNYRKMNQFSVELPLNITSLGQISLNILVELFNRGLTPNVFIIGQPDFSFSQVPESFPNWLSMCQRKANRKFSREQTLIKLWHINGSQSRLTDHGVLWTVHETDTISDSEANILRQWDHVCVTSNYTKEVLKRSDVAAEVVTNPFDSVNFHKVDLNKEGLEDVVTFGLFGKLENRKNIPNIIKMWCHKFGGNKKYRLTLGVWNNFLTPEQNSQAIHRIFAECGGQPWNVSAHPFSAQNSIYNQLLNSIDIDLSGLSLAEGWNMNLFQTLALGKHAVVHNNTGHKEFADSSNSLLIESDGLVSCEDGMFYQKGAEFNIGSFPKYNVEEAIAAMEKILEKVGSENTAGTKIPEKFTIKRTVDSLLGYVK